MAELIRAGRGRNGLVSSVSGILTKQGFGLWSSQAGANGFSFSDVSADAARQTKTIAVADACSGRAVVARPWLWRYLVVSPMPCNQATVRRKNAKLPLALTCPQGHT